MLVGESLGSSFMTGLDQIHHSWGWFVTLGIGLMILGAICIVGEFTATVLTVLVLGR